MEADKKARGFIDNELLLFLQQFGFPPSSILVIAKAFTMTKENGTASINLNWLAFITNVHKNTIYQIFKKMVDLNLVIKLESAYIDSTTVWDFSKLIEATKGETVNDQWQKHKKETTKKRKIAKIKRNDKENVNDEI